MRVARPLAGALLAAALAAPAASANPNVGANDPSPLSGAPLYVDAFEQPSVRASRAALADGRAADAAKLRRLSRLVGGKHFVVNTAENGSGRLFVRERNGRRKRHFLVHCNPRNSSLGHPPTTTLDHRGRRLPAKVDGYLWIGRPGASAGPCRQFPGRYAMRGGPNAGRFWLKRALLLAGRSKFE